VPADSGGLEAKMAASHDDIRPGGVEHGSRQKSHLK
jgi:hypothetical protein